MRRPLLILFIIVLVSDFLIIVNRKDKSELDNKNMQLRGVVKEKLEKEKCNQYRISGYLVVDYARKGNLEIGKKIEVKGTYKSLNNLKLRDFDYGRYLKSLGYKGEILLSGYRVIGESYLYLKLGKLKEFIRNTNRHIYKEYSDFLNAILIADTSSMSEDENQIFRKTGTSHVISISGLHTSILCTFISIIIGGVNKRYKLGILLSIMSIYMMMLGFLPSAVRSIVFTIVCFYSIFIDKKYDGISTLAFIGSFLILENGYIIYNTSFQLSFLATLSILYFEPIIYRMIKMKIISITISSNILIIPIMYYIFNGIPVLTILGNLIVVPFMTLIMYFSIFSLIFYRFIILSKAIAFINISILKTIFYLLGALSNLSFSYFEVNSANLYFVLIYYLIVFAFMIYYEIYQVREQKNELRGYD